MRFPSFWESCLPAVRIEAERHRLLQLVHQTVIAIIGVLKGVNILGKDPKHAILCLDHLAQSQNVGRSDYGSNDLLISRISCCLRKQVWIMDMDKFVWKVSRIPVPPYHVDSAGWWLFGCWMMPWTKKFVAVRSSFVRIQFTTNHFFSARDVVSPKKSSFLSLLLFTPRQRCISSIHIDARVLSPRICTWHNRGACILSML